MIRIAASLWPQPRPTAGFLAAWTRRVRYGFAVTSFAYLIRHRASGRFGGWPATGTAAVGRRRAMGA